MSSIRYDVRFIGRVQGVFFRATAQKIACDYEVTGWVRNEPDGSVRLVAEGEAVGLDRFIDAVRNAKQSNIEDVRIVRTDATGEFSGFAIRP